MGDISVYRPHDEGDGYSDREYHGGASESFPERSVPERDSRFGGFLHLRGL